MPHVSPGESQLRRSTDCTGHSQLLGEGAREREDRRNLAVVAMAQGNFKKSGGAPKMKGKAGRGNVAAKSRRLVNKGKTAVKKGSWNMPPKKGGRVAAAKEEMATTKMINSTNEQQAAAKCFQNQEKLFLRDVKESGRELARDIKRKALKRKKTRIEEKLEQAKEKLERVEKKHA